MAETSSTEHSTRDDVITELTKDHNELRELFDRIRRSRSDAKKAELAREIITELVKHSVAEEQYLYPAARRVLPDGDVLADHEIAEHAEVERLLATLEKLEPGEPSFETVVEEVVTSTLHHVEDEEKDLFPRLRKALDQAELDRLGDAVRLAKQTAPTHPHPTAPDRPPFNWVGDPMAGLVDRVRDAFTGSR